MSSKDGAVQTKTRNDHSDSDEDNDVMYNNQSNVIQMTAGSPGISTNQTSSFEQQPIEFNQNAHIESLQRMQSNSSFSENSAPQKMKSLPTNKFSFITIFRVTVLILCIYSTVLSTYNFMAKCDCNSINSSSKMANIYSVSPTLAPSQQTFLHSFPPSRFPSHIPTKIPSESPSFDDTRTPSTPPTSAPSNAPTVDAYIGLMNVIQTQNVSINTLSVSMNALSNLVDDIRTRKNSVYIWYQLGSIPKGGSVTYSLSTGQVPTNAKQIHVYIELQSGYNAGDDTQNRVSTSVTAHGRTYTHFMFFHSYDQVAYSFNSDNVWFPIPTNRQITVQTSSSWTGIAGGSVIIIGYTL